MSELIIIPNFEKKTAKFHGVVAGGEHATVVLKDCADLTTEGLRVRVLDCRKMVALFPHLETDEFTVSGNDLTFTLNLNSVELLDSISSFDEKEFLFIIDNPSDSIRRLYADGFHPIKKWVMIEGSDTPISLDDYQTSIERFESRLDDVEEKANESDRKAASAVQTTTSFQQDLSSLGNRVSQNEKDIGNNLNSITSLDAKVNSHINDKNNPHNVTAEQLGLGNVLRDIQSLGEADEALGERITDLDEKKVDKSDVETLSTEINDLKSEKADKSQLLSLAHKQYVDDKAEEAKKPLAQEMVATPKNLNELVALNMNLATKLGATVNGQSS